MLQNCDTLQPFVWVMIVNKSRAQSHNRPVGAAAKRLSRLLSHLTGPNSTQLWALYESIYNLPPKRRTGRCHVQPSPGTRQRSITQTTPTTTTMTTCTNRGWVLNDLRDTLEADMSTPLAINVWDTDSSKIYRNTWNIIDYNIERHIDILSNQFSCR